MPGGRPDTLTTLVDLPPPQPGQAARRTTVGDAICAEVERLGCSAGMAARRCPARISAQAVYKWINEGRDAAAKAEAGQKLTKAEQRLAAFVDSFDRANASYLARQLALHEQIAEGTLTTAEVVEEVDPTQIVDRADLPEGRGPKVLKRRVKTTRMLPNAEAIRWNIERKSRGDDKAGIPDEHLGPAIEVNATVEQPDKTADLARQLLAEAEKAADAYLQGVEDGRAREAEIEASTNGAEP